MEVLTLPEHCFNLWEGVPAVDDDRLSRNVRGVVRSEERDDPRDFLRSPPPFQSRLLRESGAVRGLRPAAGGLRANAPQRERVHANPLRPIAQREGPGQGQNSGLRDEIRNPDRVARQGGRRSDEDDTSAPRLDHGRQERLAHKDRSEQVDLDGSAHLGRREGGVFLVPLLVPEWMARETRGDIEAADCLQCVPDEPVAIGRIRDVRLNRDRFVTEFLDGTDRRLGGLAPSVILQGDVGPFLREFEDRGASDAAAAARDEGHAAVETTHTGPSRSRRNKSLGPRSENLRTHAEARGRIGILYLFTSLYFFVAAGLLALTFLAKH